MTLRLGVLSLLALGAAFSAAAQDAPPAQQDPQPALDLATLPATLLLSLEEMVNVEAAIAAGPLARSVRGEDADPDRFRLRQNLYVSAIVYVSPSQWTVWVNGNPVSPDRPSSVFEVVEVGQTHVRLAVPWGAGGTRDVLLRSHQTFVPRRGDVLEGKY
ncbi:MAG: hypothetical protein WCZ23_08080 [Rhodospirillaceae bacterium]